MKRLFQTFLKVEGKNIKFKAAFIVLILTIIGCLTYLNKGIFNDLEGSTASEVVSLNSALDQFRKVDATDSEHASPLYKNLIQQSNDLANRTLGITFNDSETTIEGSLELAKERNKIYEMNGFEEVEEYIPSFRLNVLDTVKYEALDKENKSVYFKNNNFPSYILLVFTVLGYFWYLYCGILSSDILLNDERHSSIVKNYPFTMAEKLLVKTLNYIVLLVSFLTIGIIVAILIGVIKFDSDFYYPIAILGTGFQTVSVTSFIVISWIYLIILTIIAVLVSVVLNYFIKNLYIVIFIHIGIFMLGNLSGAITKLTWMLPYHYLNYTNLFSGVIFEQSDTLKSNILFGGISLIITCLLIISFILIRFHLSNMKPLNKEVR